ncbi:phosphate signaling complex protein PhoU [Pontivivens insulae]|uniref:Phosphate-specific transport system accessory protein PhoU n=1 Tax=Pontivivens insulae TaxID=1639689 RepID=A0A2R8A736_9RHOB|nr:phosphate signaling complex protein PhoU [Pontivivens insulae]RED18164.1 PhoU-like phosphate uptake regulator [Pontivivens insulae]SPF28061.1 Phosphate-specific transport system accessory protein PhoU [Pontivivens insulae]
MGPHIVSAFDDDLIAVQARISEMGGLAEDMLSSALEAVKNRDPQLANEVIMRDKRLDALEMQVEELATRVIALRQPMAGDLRLMISALKMASTLERIGDLAKNIARRAVYLASVRPVKVSTSIVRMGTQTLGQLTEVLDAYTSRDTDLAVSIWQRDIEVDEMYNAIFREVVTYMMEDPRTIGLGSQLLFIAKNLERIGDHTTHLAEMVYYIVEGEPLGDDRPKGEPIGLEGL